MTTIRGPTAEAYRRVGPPMGAAAILVPCRARPRPAGAGARRRRRARGARAAATPRRSPARCATAPAGTRGYCSGSYSAAWPRSSSTYIQLPAGSPTNWYTLGGLIGDPRRGGARRRRASAERPARDVGPALGARSTRPRRRGPRRGPSDPPQNAALRSATATSRSPGTTSRPPPTRPMAPAGTAASPASPTSASGSPVATTTREGASEKSPERPRPLSRCSRGPSGRPSSARHSPRPPSPTSCRRGRARGPRRCGLGRDEVGDEPDEARVELEVQNRERTARPPGDGARQRDPPRPPRARRGGRGCRHRARRGRGAVLPAGRAARPTATTGVGRCRHRRTRCRARRCPRRRGSERPAGLGDAVDRFGQLPHHRGVLGVPEIEAVDERGGARADTGDVEGRLGDRRSGAGARVDTAPAGVRIRGHRDALAVPGHPRCRQAEKGGVGLPGPSTVFRNS